MPTTRRLLALTAAAAVLIVLGALFLIAPVWQPQRPAAAYVPVTAQVTAAPQPQRINSNTATADAAAVKGISQQMTESWQDLAEAK